MPVYFGFKPSGDQEVSASLSAKGLSLARSSPDRLGIVALPSVTIPSWSAYTSLLPAIIHASFTQQLVSTLRAGYSLPRPPSYLDFTLPKLAISFDTLPEENRNALEVLGFFFTRIRNKDTWLHDTPSIATMQAILRYNPIETTNPPFGYVNLASFKGGLVLLKLVTMFHAVHGFAGFSRKIQESDYVRVGPDSRKRKATSEAGESATSAASSSRTVDRQVLPWELLFERPADIVHTDPLQGVMVRSRAPDLTVFLLTQSTVESPGLIFPYVSDLCLPDDTTVLHFVTTYLMKCLGETLSRQREVLALLRSSWGNLKKTEFGNQLSHYCAVASMALRSQSYLNPIFYQGVYEGSLLHGTNFEVQVAGVVHSEMSAENLVEDLGSLGLHGSSLEKILRLLQPTTNDMVMPEIRDMFALHRQICSQGVPTTVLAEVRRLATLLRFKPSWPVNTDTLCKAMELASGKREFDETCPLRADVLGSESRVTLAFSCFGLRAPSFRIPSGTKIELDKPTPAPQIPGRGKGQKKQLNAALWSVNVRLVSLGTAVSDWELVVRERAITAVAPSTARNAGFRTFDSADKGRLLGMLRECTNAQMSDMPTPLPAQETISRHAQDTVFDF